MLPSYHGCREHNVSTLESEFFNPSKQRACAEEELRTDFVHQMRLARNEQRQKNEILHHGFCDQYPNPFSSISAFFALSASAAADNSLMPLSCVAQTAAARIAADPG
jgi:hypothetical protein